MGLKEWLSEPTDWHKEMYKQNKEAFVERTKAKGKAESEWTKHYFNFLSVVVLSFVLIIYGFLIYAIYLNK